MQEPERPHPLVPVLLAWLIPGAGHLKLGRKWPALFIAAAVLPLYFFGMVLTDFENVSLERHPWYFALHAWSGLPTAFATLLTRGREVTQHMPHASVGTLYTAVASLLNLMAMADCWARCKRGDPEAMAERARAIGASDLVSPPAEGDE